MYSYDIGEILPSNVRGMSYALYNYIHNNNFQTMTSTIKRAQLQLTKIDWAIFFTYTVHDS